MSFKCHDEATSIADFFTSAKATMSQGTLALKGRQWLFLQACFMSKALRRRAGRRRFMRLVQGFKLFNAICCICEVCMRNSLMLVRKKSLHPARPIKGCPGSKHRPVDASCQVTNRLL
jgi:hypothetical protein